jgi:folate-dependent phosphoribosylglycinamide formyltransferase PurN
VDINQDDTADSLAARVNKAEHQLQWFATNEVIKGTVHWDGKNPDSLVGLAGKHFGR